jgi:adiponectin receptor
VSGSRNFAERCQNGCFAALSLPTIPAAPLSATFLIIKSPLFIIFGSYDQPMIDRNSEVHRRGSKPFEDLTEISEMADVPEAVGLLPDNAEDVVDKARRSPRLLSFGEMPDWYQDNCHITGGYRPISNSYSGSFASWCYLHNEFVNIHTHGLGAVFYSFLGFGLYFALKDRYATSSVGDVLACGCFFLSALLCLGMSATFHTIINHSPKVKKFGHALDYLGIICLIAGSLVPNVYYGYYCDPHLQVGYWSMVSDGIPALINLRINISKRED